jgi:hypothetical protein
MTKTNHRRKPPGSGWQETYAYSIDESCAMEKEIRKEYKEVLSRRVTEPGVVSTQGGSIYIIYFRGKR